MAASGTAAMPRIRSVLFVEDRMRDVSWLVERFERDGRFVRKVEFRPEDIQAYIEAGETADVVILDWKLSAADDEGASAVALIEEFLQSGVIGIAVFTNVDTDLVEGELKKKDLLRNNRVRVCSKSDGPDAVVEYVTRLEREAGFPLAFSLYSKGVYRRAVNLAVGTVCDWDEERFRVLTLCFKKDGLENGSQVREALMSLVGDVVHDYALSAGEVQFSRHIDEYCEELKTAAAALNNDRVESLMEPWRSARCDRWYDTRIPPPEGRLRLGDVLRLRDGYVLVVTPRCDLARAEKESCVTVLVGAPLTGDTNKILDCVCGRAKRYTILFDMPEGDRSCPSGRHVMFEFARTHAYTVSQILDGRWVCRVRTPYIDDLVQSLAKYYLRIGVPSDPWKNEKEWKKVAERWV